MRKIAVVFLLLSLLLITAQALSAQETRPRRVGQSTNTGTTASPDTSTQTTPTRPPVLGGSPTSNGQQRTPQSSPTPANETEEVGEGDVVRVNTTLVTVPVSVMDRDGKFIPYLRQQDFHIYEDGVEQQVSYFASVEKPFTVVLLLDTSGSTRFRLEEIQDAAIAFVNQLRTDDRVMVVSFDDDIHVLTEPTSNRGQLRQAIQRTRTGDGTRLYDAVDMVMNQRLNRIDGRKAIVLFTDGVDTTSRHANYQSNIRDAEELDALIYSVQYDTYQDMGGGGGGGGTSWPNSPLPSIIWRWPLPGGSSWPFPGGGRRGGGGGGRRGGGGGGAGNSSADYARGDRYLHEISQKTGARVYRTTNTSDLEQAFAYVAEELRRQYSLGYYPKTAAQTGQRRQIKVRVNQPNLVVRSRDSYISGASQSNTAQGSSQNQQSQPPVLRPNHLNSKPEEATDILR
ncbi:MAG: VWA domain-containing protein [Pyrinomonadaceae bacterium]